MRRFRDRRLWMTATVVLVCLAASLPSLAQTDSTAAVEPGKVTDLLLSGRVDDLTDGVATGAWEGTGEGDLARALVMGDGLDAADAFRSLATRSGLSKDAQTIAWFNLYGYARLVDDRDKVNHALAMVNEHPDLAKRLFHSAIPAPMSPKPVASHDSTPAISTTSRPSAASGLYGVQIGAFGAKSNAQRLAAREAKKGYTVDVVPLKSGGRTLYAVWVGRFPSSSEAAAFGRRVYGTEGKDFRVVDRK